MIVEKPWGSYEFEPANCVQKQLTIQPGQRISLQFHKLRHEVWEVLSGVGIANVGEAVVPLVAGSTVFVPRGAIHRLSNTDQTSPLILTEYQLGECSEEDITRIEDAYGRG